MNRYDCPYVSDGIEYSVVIWASTEAEAAEKMRSLPWQAGNGPLSNPRQESQESWQGIAITALLLVSVIASATLYRRADVELKQVATMMHFPHMAYPPKGKAGYRA